MKFFKQQYQSYKKQMDMTKKKKNDVQSNTKLFVGGLRQETTEETLLAYFSSYGEISECNILRDAENQNLSRGFAYIDFMHDASAIAAMAEINRIDGKIVDLQWPKKDAPESKNIPYNPSKIFVGGMTAKVDEAMIREHFSKFGNILNVTIMKEKQDASRHRGFAYVLFQHESSVPATMSQYFSHRLDGKWVEVKPCVPKGKVTALEYGSSTTTNYQNMGEYSWLFAEMQKEDAWGYIPKQPPRIKNKNHTHQQISHTHNQTTTLGSKNYDHGTALGSKKPHQPAPTIGLKKQDQVTPNFSKKDGQVKVSGSKKQKMYRQRKISH
jgi:RNA recognition motif-containing protein